MEDTVQMQPLETKHVQLVTTGCTYCVRMLIFDL